QTCALPISLDKGAVAYIAALARIRFELGLAEPDARQRGDIRHRSLVQCHQRSPTRDLRHLHRATHGPAKTISQRLLQLVIPAKSGIHSSVVSEADRWIPAFAGMTVKLL